MEKVDEVSNIKSNIVKPKNSIPLKSRVSKILIKNFNTIVRLLIIIFLIMLYSNDITKDIFIYTSTTISKINEERFKKLEDNVSKTFFTVSVVKGVLAVLEDLEISGGPIIVNMEIEVGNIIQAIKKYVDILWILSATSYIYTIFYKYAPDILALISNYILIPLFIILLIVIFVARIFKVTKNKIQKIQKLIILNTLFIIFSFLIFPIIGLLSYSTDVYMQDKLKVNLEELQVLENSGSNIIDNDISGVKEKYNDFKLLLKKLIFDVKVYLKNISFMIFYFVFQVFVLPILAVFVIYIIFKILLQLTKLFLFEEDKILLLENQRFTLPENS